MAKRGDPTVGTGRAAPTGRYNKAQAPLAHPGHRRSVDIDKRIRIQQRQAQMLERSAASEKLGHHRALGGVWRAPEDAIARGAQPACRGQYRPRAATRTASARAASRANWLFKSDSACGAIVVTGRWGQLALVSGRSNTSKNG